MHVKPVFTPDYTIVYSHANAEVIIQLSVSLETLNILENRFSGECREISIVI